MGEQAHHGQVQERGAAFATAVLGSSLSLRERSREIRSRRLEVGEMRLGAQATLHPSSG
jgi:hypothetical protein